MTELKEAILAFQLKAVAVGKIVMKTAAMKAAIVAKIIEPGTAESKWGDVLEGRGRKIVQLLAASVEDREVRTDTDGSWLGTVGPLVTADTCGSVGCLLELLSVHDETVDDESAVPHCDDVEENTEKQTQKIQ